VDDLTRRILQLFIEMGREALDLHTLFEGRERPGSTTTSARYRDAPRGHRRFGITGRRLLCAHRQRPTGNSV